MGEHSSRNTMTARKAAAIADTALRWSPLQLSFRIGSSHKLATLAYHGIDDPSEFVRQLDYLRRHHHPISVAELAVAIRRQEPLPRHPVLITFDDGMRSVVEIALPLMQERGIPGAAFVVAGHLDTHKPFWWEEVEYLFTHGGRSDPIHASSGAELIRGLKTRPDQERLAMMQQLRDTACAPPLAVPQLTTSEVLTLESAGITIGNHSLTHPLLDRCDDRKVQGEIEEAHLRLSGILGHEPTVFAYPNGNIDPRARQALANHGYEAAFLFDHRLGPTPPTDPLGISRLRVNSTTPMNRYAVILSGLHPAIHRARGRS